MQNQSGIIKGSTDQSWSEFFTTTSTSTAGQTGIIASNVTIWWWRPDTAVPVSSTCTALGSVDAAHTDYGFIEVDATNLPGLYRIDFPDAMLAEGSEFVIYQITATPAGYSPMKSVSLLRDEMAVVVPNGYVDGTAGAAIGRLNNTPVESAVEIVRDYGTGAEIPWLVTVQSFAQRLARYTQAGTLANMGAEDLLLIVDCINSAIFRWFAEAPENMRQTTISHRVRAPESISLDLTNGSVGVQSGAFSEFQIGCAVDIAGEKNWNEVVSTGSNSTLLNSYRGVTGTVSAMIYYDTIMLTDYLVNRIVSDPRVVDTGVFMARDDAYMAFVGAERRGPGTSGIPGAWWIRQGRTGSNIIGEPYRYVIENTGVSQNDEARIMIRMDPAPEREFTVQFDAVLDATPVSLSDLNGQVKIPVPKQYVAPHLLPIALAELAGTPIWHNEETVDKQLARSEKATEDIGDQIDENRARPGNVVRTSPGF